MVVTIEVAKSSYNSSNKLIQLQIYITKRAMSVCLVSKPFDMNRRRERVVTGTNRRVIVEILSEKFSDI